MKTKKVSLFIAFVLLANFIVQAQLWEKLKKKAKQKIENKIENKTDKMLDNALNTDTKKNNSNTKAKYIFTGRVTIEITSDGEKASFNVLFNNNSEMFCMHMNAGDGQDIYNVITPKRAEMFMNASGMKIKKASSVDEFSQYDYSDKIPSKDDLKKTGNTKTILGYVCEEYQYKNDGGSISAWVTQNFPIKAKYAPMLGMTTNTPIKGFILEINSSTNNGEKATIKVVKIDTNKKVVINTAEYKSMF